MASCSCAECRMHIEIREKLREERWARMEQTKVAQLAERTKAQVRRAKRQQRLQRKYKRQRQEAAKLRMQKIREEVQ